VKRGRGGREESKRRGWRKQKVQYVPQSERSSSRLLFFWVRTETNQTLSPFPLVQNGAYNHFAVLHDFGYIMTESR
jgi:hypothetical protein